MWGMLSWYCEESRILSSRQTLCRPVQSWVIFTSSATEAPNTQPASECVRENACTPGGLNGKVILSSPQIVWQAGGFPDFPVLPDMQIFCLTFIFLSKLKKIKEKLCVLFFCNSAKGCNTFLWKFLVTVKQQLKPTFIDASLRSFTTPILRVAIETSTQV